MRPVLLVLAAAAATAQYQPGRWDGVPNLCAADAQAEWTAAAVYTAGGQTWTCAELATSVKSEWGITSWPAVNSTQCASPSSSAMSGHGSATLKAINDAMHDVCCGGKGGRCSVGNPCKTSANWRPDAYDSTHASGNIGVQETCQDVANTWQRKYGISWHEVFYEGGPGVPLGTACLQKATDGVTLAQALHAQHAPYGLECCGDNEYVDRCKGAPVPVREPIINGAAGRSTAFGVSAVTFGIALVYLNV